jgi:hypothetical protein
VKRNRGLGDIELASLTIISTRACGTARSRERSGAAKVPSFVVFPALLLAFVVTLLLSLLPVLRGSLALRSLVLPLRRCCHLLALDRPLLWLLPLGLGGSATLLRRRMGGGGLLNVSASPLLRLCVWGRCSALLLE